MMILSKYWDYYDSAVGMGIDKTIVYQRHTRQELVPDELNTALDKTWNSYGYHSFTREFVGNIPQDKYSSRLIYVGFCGKVYVGLAITKEIVNKYTLESRNDITMIWDHDKIRKLLKKDKPKAKYSWQRQNSSLEDFNNYILEFESKDFSEWFRKFNTPIFSIGQPPLNDNYYWIQKYKITNDGGNLYINPILKDYQFAKVFDPYTAFQEIQMYVSGVLGVSKDGTEYPATEKEKVAQHGMNKWSFRRPSRK